MRILGSLVLACLTAVVLAAPVGAQTTVKVVMHSALRVLDPIVTTAYITRNHGYMIYDTLFAQDENFKIQPQMVKSWTQSPDKLTYTFVLRDGLKWHDGQPVTAEDCVASIKRWAQTDTMGQKLMEYTASLTAPDAKTIRLQLKSPYGLVLDSLGKPSSNVPFMMPRRIAEKPANKALGPEDQIGSGPFKFVQGEFQPGVKAVYVKNTEYVPRSEKPSWGSGGKVVKIDRVEWVTMPDHQTAVNALIAGEIDYMESPPHDLYPILEQAPGVKMQVINKLGLQGMLRFNHLHPPFNNPKIRQAVAYAVNQEDYMKAWISDPKYRRTCFAMFVCNTPLATTAGSEGLMRGNIEKAKQLLKEAGYDGTPIVIMHPTDVATIATYPIVTAQALRKAGFNVDVQAMDWQTLVGRRAKQEPPSQGGWNMFHTNWVAHDVMNPIGNAGVNTKGPKGGWFGWPSDPQIEDMRDQFARESDPAKQKKIAEAIQRRAYEIGAYLPLGEYTGAIAFRDHLTGILDGPVPYLWNIEKKK
ncbi:MAG TPA: ABC transporter substrate-binding protein [Candidatus Tectomicrobia bacterium]|nr:ABC transporter substrate-binding protein [Candidatus Tectomicrobia bacterium]